MKDKICIIGLGYVGLPLAHAFSSKYPVVGFDINEKRIEELNKKFGLNASVEFAPYEDYEEIMKLLELDSNTSIKDFNINKNLDVKEGDDNDE